MNYNTDVLQLDVSIQNERLVLKAVDGIKWLKDQHGEYYQNRMVECQLTSFEVEEHRELGQGIASIKEAVDELRRDRKWAFKMAFNTY